MGGLTKAQRDAKKLRDAKPKPISKEPIKKGGFVRQAVRKTELRSRRAMPAVQIVTIQGTVVHSVDTDKVYVEQTLEQQVAEEPRKVKSQLLGHGNVSKMGWSGSMMGDQMERKAFKWQQKVVKIDETPEVDKDEEKPKPDAKVEIVDDKGNPIKKEDPQVDDTTDSENGS